LFAQTGAHVFVTDRAEGSGREVVQQIVEDGGHAEFALLDIAELSQCAAVAERVLTDVGRLDILVNNAGDW
jgi:NAD(P)-dependent dehydrogenase (short-subunit alcohol dehydrogenase family)